MPDFNKDNYVFKPIDEAAYDVRVWRELTDGEIGHMLDAFPSVDPRIRRELSDELDRRSRTAEGQAALDGRIPDGLYGSETSGRQSLDFPETGQESWEG